ncbi:MAG: methylated-DNA--[protein]-cysteine S-methyltransferase [Saprospiraceae bacterium]|nr:methylated-DNA--[protein]-cysteine S-methyltransferase [Saprospiraceae bacterium]
MSDQTLHFSIVASPIGNWRINADEKTIKSIEMVEDTASKDNSNSITSQAARQLMEYFAGERYDFNLALDTEPYTAFYQSVWKALEAVPYGKTTNYSALANQIGNPDAVRAVGLANGKNPFPIVIPCHRVIGKDHSLTGYAFGLPAKKWLLELEGVFAHQMELF